MNKEWKIEFPVDAELFIRIEYSIEFILKHFEKIDLYIPIWKRIEQEGLENKVAHEFALLIFLVSRIENKPDNLNRLVCKAAESISEFIRTESNYSEIVISPQKLTRLGQIHIFLSLAGNKNDKWDALIIKMQRKGYGQNSERILTRLFDRNWLNNLLFDKDIFDLDEIIKYSIINSRCHPIYMSSSEMYAYTHTLMYISDFGNIEIKNGSGYNNLKDTIDSSILSQLAEDNYDLICEFLMNYTYVDNRWSTISFLSWKHITFAWDNFGFLPGISFDKEIYDQLNDEEKSAYAFKEVYHTNLVAGILCSGILQSKRRENKITIDYPQVFSLSKVELKGAIESGKLFYNINQAIRLESNINSEMLLQQVQALIGNKSIPHWVNLFSNINCGAEEKNAILIELKMMLSIKKQKFDFLIESINQYIILDLEINQTFVEAVEFICNRQIKSGEFLIPDRYIPSLLSVLSTVHERLNNISKQKYL